MVMGSVISVYYMTPDNVSLTIISVQKKKKNDSLHYGKLVILKKFQSLILFFLKGLVAELIIEPRGGFEYKTPN